MIDLALYNAVGDRDLRTVKEIVGAVLCLLIVCAVYWLMTISADVAFCPDVEIQIGDPAPDHGCRTDMAAATVYYGAPIVGVALMALIYWALRDRRSS
jgi:hypothetical protein